MMLMRVVKRVLKSIRAYWPGLNPDLLQPSYSGIRPKITGLDDFQIIKKEINGRIFVSVLGYESPGLSASLGLSAYVSWLLNEWFLVNVFPVVY